MSLPFSFCFVVLVVWFRSLFAKSKEVGLVFYYARYAVVWCVSTPPGAPPIGLTQKKIDWSVEEVRVSAPFF